MACCGSAHDRKDQHDPLMNSLNASQISNRSRRKNEGAKIVQPSPYKGSIKRDEQSARVKTEEETIISPTEIH